jgi:hypothetical protein
MAKVRRKRVGAKRKHIYFYRRFVLVSSGKKLPPFERGVGNGEREQGA